MIDALLPWAIAFLSGTAIGILATVHVAKHWERDAEAKGFESGARVAVRRLQAELSAASRTRQIIARAKRTRRSYQ